MEPPKLPVFPKNQQVPAQGPAGPSAVGYAEPHFNKLAASLMTILDTSAKLVFEHEIKPLFAKSEAPADAKPKETVEMLPEFVKKAADIFLKIGFGVNMQFENAVEAQELGQPPSKELYDLFKWLLSDEGKSVAIAAAPLIETLKTKLQRDSHPYLEYLLKWMQTDRKAPIKESIKLMLYSEASAKEALLAIVNELVAQKATRFANHLAAKIQRELPEILPKFLSENVMQVIGRLELDRAIAIIKKLNWSQLIDGSVEDARDHFQNVHAGLTAQNAYLEERIADRSHAVETLDKKTLNSIHTIAENRMLRAFASRTSHPIMQKIAQNEVNMEWNLPQEERAFYAKASSDLMKIFAPSSYKELSEWYDKLNLPPELKQMKEELHTFSRQLLDAQTHDFLVKAPRKVGEFVQLFEESLIGLMHRTAVNEMVKLIQAKINKYTNPDKLNEFIAKKILPVAFVEIYKQVAKNAFEVQFKTRKAELLVHVLELKNAIGNDDLLNGRRENLRLKLQKWSKEFSPTMNEPTHDPKIVDKGIDAFIALLEEKIKGAAADEKGMETAIAELYKVTPADPYGSAQAFMNKNLPFFTEQFELYLLGSFEARNAIYQKLRNEFKDSTEKTFEPLVENLRKMLLEVQMTLNKPYLEKKDKNELGPNDRPTGLSREYIRDFLSRRFAGEASRIGIYFDLIHQIVGISDYQKFTGLVGWFREKAVNGLMSATKDLRLSPAFALSMAADMLPKSLDYATLDNLIYGPDGLDAPKERDSYNRLKGKLKTFERALVSTEQDIDKETKDGALKMLRESKRNLDTEISTVKAQLESHPITLQAEKLKREYHKIAGLTQDLVPVLQGFTGFLAKKFVTNGREGIAQSIDDLIKKILGNQLRTKGLIFKMIDRIARTLLEGQEKVLAEG